MIESEIKIFPVFAPIIAMIGGVIIITELHIWWNADKKL